MPIHGNKILSRYKTYYESEMIRLCSCAPATPLGLHPFTRIKFRKREFNPINSQ